MLKIPKGISSFLLHFAYRLKKIITFEKINLLFSSRLLIFLVTLHDLLRRQIFYSVSRINGA